jgi:hypothetical protein
MFRNCCMIGVIALMVSAEAVAQRHADGRANHTLHQPLGQDQPGDGAAAGADGAQHADIAAALGDDGAEGVEDDETAHQQPQPAQHIHDDRAEHEAVEHLGAGLQRADGVAGAQAGLDIGLDGGAFCIVQAVKVSVNHVDLARCIQYFLGFGQRDQHFFIPRQQPLRQDADDGQLGQAGGGGDGQGVAYFQPGHLGQRFGDNGRGFIVVFQEAAFQNIKGRNRADFFWHRTDQGQRADAVWGSQVAVEIIGLQVDGALQRAGYGSHPLHGGHLRGHRLWEGFAGLVSDGDVHHAGHGHGVGLEGLRESGHQRVHAEDQQHAEDNRQGGQHRAQPAPGQVTKSKGKLKVHGMLLTPVRRLSLSGHALIRRHCCSGGSRLPACRPSGR